MIAKEAIEKLNMIKSGDLIPVLSQQTPANDAPFENLKYVRALASGAGKFFTPITKPIENHLIKVGTESLQRVKNGEIGPPLGYHSY